MVLRVTLQLFSQNQKVNQSRKHVYFFRKNTAIFRKNEELQSSQSQRISINTLIIFRLHSQPTLYHLYLKTMFLINNQHFSQTLQLCNCKVIFVLWTLQMGSVEMTVCFGEGCLHLA